MSQFFLAFLDLPFGCPLIGVKKYLALLKKLHFCILSDTNLSKYANLILFTIAQKYSIFLNTGKPRNINEGIGDYQRHKKIIKYVPHVDVKSSSKVTFNS